MKTREQVCSPSVLRRDAKVEVVSVVGQLVKLKATTVGGTKTPRGFETENDTFVVTAEIYCQPETFRVGEVFEGEYRDGFGINGGLVFDYSDDKVFVVSTQYRNLQFQ